MSLTIYLSFKTGKHKYLLKQIQSYIDEHNLRKHILWDTLGKWLVWDQD